VGSAAAGQVDGELGEGCVGNHESRVWRRRRAHLQAASSDAIIGLPAWGRDAPVNPIVLGLIAVVLFGFASVLTMIPLPLPEKTRAMAGAFLNRFAIGSLIVMTDLPVAAWLRGLIVSLLMSLPDAVITRAYTPILAIGAGGGVIVGLAAGWWAK